MKVFFILIYTGLISFCGFSQTTKITGVVKISVGLGIIEADIEVTNIPTIKDFRLWLNSGLNIEYIRDLSDRFNYDYNKSYDSEKSSETFQYQITKNDSALIPNGFKIKYRGAFPIIKDTLRMDEFGDWKGNMAFNGKTLRVSEQTAWYTIFYDRASDVIYNNVRYDLKFVCKDCRSIYLNGSAPSKVHNPTFKSDVPVQLMMLAGNFDFNKLEKTNFINSNLSPAEQAVLSNWTRKIINYYEGKFKIPYGSDVTYLGATPLSKRNNWAFVCYPTICVVGNKWSLSTFFNKETHAIEDSATITYFAHELGHYYFGTLCLPNSELRWFYLEGITDYVSLKATKELLGEKEYKKALNVYLEKIKDFKPVSLNKVKVENEINETYRYRFIPLMLIALEKEIGEENVWNWLNYVLTKHQNELTNYSYFKESLLKSGVKEEAFERFEKLYINSENANLNIINKVQ